MQPRATPTRPAAVVLAWTPRERARAFVRNVLPRRRFRVHTVVDATTAAEAARTELVDVVLVDLAAEDPWPVAALAREFPSIAFVGLTPGRAADVPAVERCVALDFAGILVEGMDDAAVEALLEPVGFGARFARALTEVPEPLALRTPLQREAWAHVVAHAGLPVRTEILAALLGVTREHLSRTFAAGGAPNLKRVMDLVRLIAAAELAKNPGYDVADVARVLQFASSSHLSTAAQRVVGVRPASLARLRTVDLVERFVHGRTRSRS